MQVPAGEAAEQENPCKEVCFVLEHQRDVLKVAIHELVTQKLALHPEAVGLSDIGKFRLRHAFRRAKQHFPPLLFAFQVPSYHLALQSTSRSVRVLIILQNLVQ